MALNNYGLGFQITVDDQASQVFNKVGGALGQLEEDGAAVAISMQKAANKMASMSEKFSRYGAMIIGTLSEAADSAGNFQNSIAKAGAFTDATSEQMERMHASAQNVDLAMRGFTFEEQADTLRQLANELGNADDAMKELVPSLKLAQITGKTGAQAAGFLSDAVAGFGGTADDAAGYVDKMAFSMKKFGLTSSELEGAIMPTIGAARLMGATFDDTLTMVGIANSGLGNVTKASMAATMAMQQLADPKIQKEIQNLGVSVKDSSGNFRSMIDILGDVSESTKNMTEAQRAQHAASIFGARGAGGLSIVMDQLAKGVKDAEGNMLTGAAAAAELRRQMAGAAGAADALVEASLSTLPEQKQALQSVVESLMTAVGGPLAEVLAPVTRTITQLVARITEAFLELSPTFKKVLVGIVTAAGVFMSLVGAGLAAGGVITGLVLAGKSLLIGLGVVAVAAGVLVSALAPLILFGTALYIAWTRNLGGIADKVEGWFKQIKLGFTALGELLTKGGFSEDVWTELNDGNEGIKDFAINVFLWFNRIKNFVSNVGDAFSKGMEKIGPIIERITAAFSRLMSRFGGTRKGVEENQSAFDRWGAAGEQVGNFLVGVVETVALWIEKATEFADGFVESFGGFGGVIDAATDAALSLWDAFKNIFGGRSEGEATASTWNTIGKVLAQVANVGLTVVSAQFRILGGVISFVSGLIGGIRDLFSGVVNAVISGAQFIHAIMTGQFGEAFDIAWKMVDNWVTTILSMFTKVVGGAAGLVDSLGKIFGKDLGLKAKVEGLGGQMSGLATTAVAPSLPIPSSASGSAAPAVAQAQGAAANNAALVSAVSNAKPAPVEVNSRTTLMVDGQVLADVVQKNSQQQAGRGFAPMPSPT